jgi:xylan 1,4-beta-xylosidase
MKQLIGLLLLIGQLSVTAQSLVVPGDFPDPSVIKFGDRYWATATTSNWAPAFPLLSSTDLVHWKTEGHAFAELPEWADYYFWAPEISEEKGKTYLYYTAHKRNGGLCVGIASAPSPEGPYKDHGPVMCQEAGSIDAFPMRDENGRLFLIWKEDGNSVKKPTPIWAAELNEERTAVIGEKKELFRNDATWEANLVEGVSMVRHGEYFYAFYSGAGCCGRGCTYGLGVARAKNLLGPWEKYLKNPLLISSGDWKCPGHGTPVEMGGRNFFLYHAYHKKGDVYTGRQGVLSEFRFTDDKWIEFLPAEKMETSVPKHVEDNFNGDLLSFDWQWSVFDTLKATVDNGVVTVQASPRKSGSFIGQKTLSVDFEAEAVILPVHSSAETGLGLIGDENNLIAASIKDNTIRLWKLEEGKETIIAEKIVKATGQLRMKVDFDGAEHVTFSFSTGQKFLPIAPPVNGFFLPPWDRAIRVALLAKGDSSQQSTFDSFIMRNK